MNIDFNATIDDFDGKPVVTAPPIVKDGVVVKPAEHLTLKDVALNSLMTAFPDEQNLSGEEKFKRFALAMRVAKGGGIEIQPEEAATLKNLIGRAYGALAVGRAYQILNG